MFGIKVTIIRYISDEPEPGIVECELQDARGSRWSIVEKTAVVRADHLDAQTTYPKLGLIACEVIGRTRDNAGREVIRITTNTPWRVETPEGANLFEVSPDALVEW